MLFNTCKKHLLIATPIKKSTPNCKLKNKKKKKKNLRTGKKWTVHPSPLCILTSVCIFSLMFSINFLRCWQGEFVWQSSTSLLGDVVVQSYPGFKFYFPLFQTHYHTLQCPKTKESKIWTKDKIEPQQWLLPFFLQSWFRGDIREKLETRHLQQVKGLKINVLSFYMKTLFVSHQWNATSAFHSLVSN